MVKWLGFGLVLFGLVLLGNGMIAPGLGMIVVGVMLLWPSGGKKGKTGNAGPGPQPTERKGSPQSWEPETVRPPRPPVEPKREAPPPPPPEPSKMVCPACGKVFPPEHVYCDECGSKLKSES